MAGFIDTFPKQLRQKHRRELFVAFVCLLSYIVGLSMCTNVRNVFTSKGANRQHNILKVS